VRSTSILFAGASLALCVAVGPLACSSEPTPASAADAGPVISLGDAGYLDAPDQDGSKPEVDGGFPGPDGSVLRADRFATNVVSVTYGGCAGYGQSAMPNVVYGPPVGGGALAGSLDVVSLGFKGEIVLGFGANAIVDGPGIDFIVFENPFWAGGDMNKPTAELGEVSVSDDGVTWKTFACTAGAGPQYGSCAGWRPVYSAPGNGISPVDPKTAGGDLYDLAELGMTSARFVRIRDMGSVDCPSSTTTKPTTVGFDLDAIAIVNAKTP
jgi:hypothetical protein